MTNRIKIRQIILALVMFIGLTSPLQAGGLILYELGTRDVGLASAGWAARTLDAATLFRNPAGMSKLNGSQLLIGTQLLYGSIGFTPDANTTVLGNDGGNPIGALPGGSLFYVNSLPSGFAFGFGAFSYFGLTQKYDAGWVGRYYVQEATLVGFTLMPSISYRFNDELSLGAGLNAMYGVFDQKAAVRNVIQQTDGQLALDDETWGFGANIGLLIEFTEGTRFGVTYLSPVSLDFKGTSQFTGVGPILEGVLQRTGLMNASVDLGLKVPQTIMVSLYHTLNPQWSLMGNVGWQNWQEFGKVEISVADTLANVTGDRNYQDTWHVAIGADWQVAHEWLVSAGFAYDSSPVKDEDRTLDFALGQTFRFGAGAQWQVNAPMKLGFAYELAWGGTIPVDQFRGPLAGRVSGEFRNSALHFFALNLEWEL